MWRCVEYCILLSICSPTKQYCTIFEWTTWYQSLCFRPTNNASQHFGATKLWMFLFSVSFFYFYFILASKTTYAERWATIAPTLSFCLRKLVARKMACGQRLILASAMHDFGKSSQLKMQNVTDNTFAVGDRCDEKRLVLCNSPGRTIDVNNPMSTRFQPSGDGRFIFGVWNDNQRTDGCLFSNVLIGNRAIFHHFFFAWCQEARGKTTN